jgi:RNA polymerase sigma-70 factor (ECF subfamily)
VHLSNRPIIDAGIVNPEFRSDEVLTGELKNGDLHAGSVLYTRHKQAVYSFCLRMLKDPASAQDAAQETFLKMISKIHSVQQGTTLKSWLFSVARNEVLMVLRRKKIVPMETLDDETEIFDPSTPLTLSMDSELGENILLAIGRLKPAYREAYLLRETEGMSYEEIATVTGTTVSAVKTKLFKSRTALHAMLKPYLSGGKS